MEGMFHSFPYLHIVAVKDSLRGRGIGTQLLDAFERDALEHSVTHMRAKVFLTVADYNEEAEALYVHRGYREVGKIPGLYRRHVTEKLMMKTVTV